MYDLNKFSGDFLTVFERLAVDIVNESADQNGMAEERLWSLPEAIISYHQNSPGSAQNENKESMVAALRYHSAKHFHEIPDFQNKITRLRSHLKEQERSFELARWSESDLDAYVSLLGDEDVWLLKMLCHLSKRRIMCQSGIRCIRLSTKAKLLVK
jgi:hypothetical protein